MQSDILPLLLLLLPCFAIFAILSLVAIVRVSTLRRELYHLRLAINALTCRLHALEKNISTNKTEPSRETASSKTETPTKTIAKKIFATPSFSETTTQTTPIATPPLFVPNKTQNQSVSQTLKSETSLPMSKISVSQGPTFESVIGKRWMTWIGVAILFFSAAFFLKYAFQNDIIGPTGQVALCALVGVGVLIGGTHLLRKNMRALGQGLLGLGLAILYVTFGAAASSIYDPPVLTQTPTFLLLVAVTICGMTLAILHNASAISILAVLGGLATPLLVSTGHNSRDALFTYLLLLDLGVLGVAGFRNWRVLDSIAILGTYLLYCGWFEKYYSNSQLLEALIWLNTFYLVFLALPFVFHLTKKIAVTLERFILALLNAIFAFGFMWHMLYKQHPQAFGFIAIGMATLYLGMGVVFRKRLPADAHTLFGSISLAVVFITIALPLHLHAHGITLAWAVEGPVLLYLGYRFRYFPVRMFGIIILLLSIGRLFYAHMPLHHELYVPFANRQFLSAISIPIAMSAYGFLQQKFKDLATTSDRFAKLGVSFVAGTLTLFLIQAESHNWLVEEYNKYTAACIASAIWMTGSLIYLFAGKRTKTLATWIVGGLTLFISFILLCQTFDYSRSSDSLLFINLRFIVGIAMTMCIFLFARIVGNTPVPGTPSLTGKVFWGLGILLLLGLLSHEVPSYLHRCLKWSHEAAQMALTITWGLYASALLAMGFWKRIRSLRYCGLGLFGISALKLLIVDMRQVEDLLRIISFMVVGMLMLAASYFYHRLEKTYLSEKIDFENKDISIEESEKNDEARI